MSGPVNGVVCRYSDGSQVVAPDSSSCPINPNADLVGIDAVSGAPSGTVVTVNAPLPGLGLVVLVVAALLLYNGGRR